MLIVRAATSQQLQQQLPTTVFAAPDLAHSDDMEHETLFTASKWLILKALESGPKSPIELAKLCSTSVANVSQQLRLLEMAGVVTSKRISNRDKDKPRILYSLAGNMSYMIATTGSFVDKKVLELTDYNKIIMRIWFLDNAEMRYVLEKAFWKIEEHFDKISFFALNTQQQTPVLFYYKSTTKLDLKPFTITDQTGVTRQVVFETEIPSAQHMHILHDPKGIALDDKKLRGGGK
jgi:predicted transcriptional regulator